MPDIGETGASHQANITGTDDCKIHDWGMVRANYPLHKWNKSRPSGIVRPLLFILLRTKDRSLDRIQI
jgi:hypothetical protein